MKNCCAHCDHCFAKMNGNIFCEVDGMSIQDPYDEVDCEYHTIVSKNDTDKLKDKLNEIADSLVDVYTKVKSLVEDLEMKSSNDPVEEVALPSKMTIDDATMESILRKLLG